ncbi:hypothetical protein TRFO_42117 [Tritrichomonas foetus]|uniref:Uncharacterized protein n=1 Tax=Tritrichomonas foetus TaxID=1144522 RepID=A0A1J4L286_9EUKA|nr:hypothetical protein TRFO_42117 [Tritrichomonas foetus]|eukprot:OHT16005.1 hypothetical protein TRFO_42117 [Tritrichomonas foetus]
MEVAVIRSQMRELSSDLRNIVHTLSVPLSFHEKWDMRTIDARLLSIITQSSSFVNSTKNFKPEDLKMVDSIIQQLNDKRVQSDKIAIEAVQKSEVFTHQIEQQKKEFKKTMEKVNNDYNVQRKSEVNRHKNEMDTIQSDIDRLNSTFEAKLNAEVGKCIIEKDKFQTEFNELSEKYQTMKNNLEGQLHDYDSKVEQYTKELKEMEENNAKLLVELETDYQKRIVEAEEKFAKRSKQLMDEAEDLKKKMDNFDSNSNNNDLHSIKEKLDRLNEEHEIKAQKILEEKKKELAENIENLINENAKEEMDLRQEIAKNKSENKIRKENMRQKLASLKEQATAQESLNAEKIKVTKLKADQVVSDLDSKRQKLILDQKSVIDLTKKRYLNDLKQQQKKSDATMSQSRQKLAQLQNEFEMQKKRLEAEVTALIRKRNRLQLDLKAINETGSVKNSLGYFDFVKEQVVDIQPNPSYSNKITTVNGMVNKFQTCNKKSNKKLVEMRELKMKCDQELKQEKQRLLVQLEKTKTQLNNAIDGVRLLKIRKDELLNKQRMQDTIEGTQLKKQESELKAKLLNQKEIIRQLKEELQKIRVDDSKRKQLSIIQALQKSEVKELQKQIDEFDEKVVETIENKQKELNEDLIREKEKSGEVIKKMINRLDEAFQELKKVKEVYESEAIKEQQRWMELRNDIAESNLKILANDQTKGKSRPPSSAATSSKGTPVASPLPSLRRI